MLNRQAEDAAGSVEKRLDALLADVAGAPAPKLTEAMRYAALGGGKRVRPLLVLECAALFDVDREAALNAACAVEMIHCYSLVHDDLPAMDDDPVRRGRPSLHIAYDEATAILAGDALLTLAFETLADPLTHPDPHIRAELVLTLARAAGRDGMAGGQALDLDGEGRSLDLDQIRRIERLKTGALIAFSCEAGAILGQAPRDARDALDAYGRAIGLGFQVADDMLDVSADAARLGKTPGKDVAQRKSTFVSALGLDGARELLDRLEAEAIARLAPFGARAEPLAAIARALTRRDR
jgi:farnesyl diphosphate synthase